MNYFEMSPKKQLLTLLDAVKTVGVQSLPELVQMVPIYGSVLSKALSVIISTSASCQEETEKMDIQEQIAQLGRLLEERKVTDEALRETIQKEVMKELKTSEERFCVYAFGVVLYPIQSMSTQNEEDISEILNDEVEWEEKKIQAYADTVQDFMDKYAPDKKFMICKEYLSIDLSTEYEPIIVTHQEVLKFAEALNGCLEQPFFVEYTIL